MLTNTRLINIAKQAQDENTLQVGDGFSELGRALKYNLHHRQKHLLDFHLEICPFVKKQHVLRCKTTSSHSTHSQLESRKKLEDTAEHMLQIPLGGSEKSLLKFLPYESILV